MAQISKLWHQHSLQIISTEISVQDIWLWIREWNIPVLCSNLASDSTNNNTRIHWIQAWYWWWFKDNIRRRRAYNGTYSTTTLPSKHSIPDHVQGPESSGFQFAKTPKGSNSNFALKCNSANPAFPICEDQHYTIKYKLKTRDCIVISPNTFRIERQTTMDFQGNNQKHVTRELHSTSSPSTTHCSKNHYYVGGGSFCQQPGVYTRWWKKSPALQRMIILRVI